MHLCRDLILIRLQWQRSCHSCQKFCAQKWKLIYSTCTCMTLYFMVNVIKLEGLSDVVFFFIVWWPTGDSREGLRSSRRLSWTASVRWSLYSGFSTLMRESWRYVHVYHLIVSHHWCFLVYLALKKCGKYWGSEL